MSTKRYKITLTPQEAYFFGGEHTFGRDDSRKDASRYSASSTYFPQQSALLGMLRKTFLIQNNNLTMHLKGEWVDSRGGRSGNDKNYFEATRLIGKDSFSYEDDSDYGVLQNISPIFITKNGIDYIHNAKDEGYTPKLLSTQMSLNNTPQKTLLFDGFDAKEYKKDTFIGTDKSKLSYDDIFHSVESVGIKKSIDSQSDEDGFFQKSSFILKDKASFSFYIELSEDISWSEAYVTLGADQSSFKLSLVPTEENFETKFSNIFDQKNLDRIVLNSETLVTQEVYDNALFVLGKRESYRQLKSKHGKKSKRYYLLTSGSVIYTENISQLSAALSQPHLQKVGINIFTTIKGN